MNRSKFINVLVCLLSGAIIGGICTFFLLGQSINQSIASLNLLHSADWGKRSYSAYKNETTEIGIWALQNYIDILEKHSESSPQNDDIVAHDLILAQVRIAILYRKIGDHEQFNEYISKAHALWMTVEFNNTKTKENLISFVKKIDKK